MSKVSEKLTRATSTWYYFIRWYSTVLYCTLIYGFRTTRDAAVINEAAAELALSAPDLRLGLSPAASGRMPITGNTGRMPLCA